MIFNKQFFIAGVLVLSGVAFSNTALADVLNGGNNIKVYQLSWSCSTCSSTTASITTTGFTPFLALEDDGVITQVSTTSSLTFFGNGFSGDPQSILVSQSPNITTVGTSATSGYTMLGQAIASGSETFTLNFTGFDVPTFIVVDLYAGQSYTPVVAYSISALAQKEAEESIENINRDVLRKKINHVRSTYTDHIKTLYKTGRFSLARANYAENGLNAGDTMTGVAFWFTPSYTSIKNTAMISNDSNFTGNQDSYLFGADVLLSPKLLVGGLVGYETSDTDSSDNSKTDSDGYVISAYAAYNFDSGFTAYGHIGYNSSDTDIEDRSIFGSVASFDGDYDSNNHFLGFGVMRSSELESGLKFTMDLGYNYAYTSSDSYDATLSIDPSVTNRMNLDSSNISEFLLNTELAQSKSWGEYYGTVGAILDLSNNDDSVSDDGDFGMNAGIGLRFNASEKLLGEISYNKVFLWDGHNDYTVSANVRYDF
ncbi:MAG: autotransporter outer membrane beta-barrel domain-containing protein [Gammaproteobacteria bacterium]|nr:autotransporter outer membrane beta-barrel domain-containing protein [Gammaproteobacteria bacterium]